MLLAYRLLRRRRYRAHRAKRFDPSNPPPPLRWRPRVRLVGLVTGLVGGIGAVVLLAQYGFEPVTTRAFGVRGVVGAVLSGIVIPSVVFAAVVWRFNRRLRRLSRGLGGPSGGLPLAGAASARAVLGLFAVGVGALTLLAAAPAHAVVDGPCTATFAGVDAAGRGTGASSDAITVPEDGVVAYSMAAPENLRSWRFWLEYGPLTQLIAEGTEEPDDPNDLGLGLEGDDDFLAIDLESLLHDHVVDGNSVHGAVEPSEFAWVGVGLYEVHGSVTTVSGQHCTGSILVDVGGNPLGTLLGAAAAGATAIGVAGAGAVALGGLRDGGEVLDALENWERNRPAAPDAETGGEPAAERAGEGEPADGQPEDGQPEEPGAEAPDEQGAPADAGEPAPTEPAAEESGAEEADAAEPATTAPRLADDGGGQLAEPVAVAGSAVPPGGARAPAEPAGAGGPAPAPEIDDATLDDPAAAPGDVAVVSGGPGANPGTGFDVGQGSPGTCSVFGVPRYSVNLATLNLVVEDTIYGWQGTGPAVGLRLTFNAVGSPAGMFGPGWRFAYESHLEQLDDVVYVWGGAGQTARFRIAGDGRVAALDGGSCHLAPDGDAWTLDDDGVRCRYEPVASGTVRLTEIRDRAGAAITVGHDDDGRLARLTDAAGRVVRFEHEGERCRMLVLPDGRRASFSYDTHGRLVRAVDLLGIDSVYEYDPSGRLVTIAVDGGRNVTRVAYHDAPRPVVAAVADAAGGTTAYERLAHDPTVVLVTDPSGRSTRHQSRGGLTEAVEDDAGRSFECRFEDRRLVETRTGDRTVRVDRDADGRVVRMQGPRTGERVVEYDAHGRIVAESVGELRWTVRYDDADRPVEARASSGERASLTYDNAGSLVGVEGPGGERTLVTRDGFGNIETVTAPDGGTVHLGYDHHGLRLTSVTDALGNVTRFEYDANDRIVGQLNPDGTETAYEHSCCAGVASVDELGHERRFRRDQLLRITSVVDETGAASLVEHDPAGLVTRVTDPLGRSLGWLHDRAGLPVGLVNPDDTMLAIERDVLGRAVALVTERGGRTEFAYDAGGRVVACTDPLGRAVRVDMDEHGRVVQRVDGRGVARRIERNARGRVGRTSVDGEVEASFEYDVAGRLVAMHDASGSTRWQRGPTGRIEEMEYPDGTGARFRHDLAGHVVAVEHPDGSVVEYEWDGRSRLAAARFDGHAVRFAYDAAGDLVGEERSNGCRSSYAYDPAARIVSIRHEGPAGLFAAADYQRDAVGRIVAASGVELVSVVLDDVEIASHHDVADQVVRRGDVEMRHDGDGNLVEASDGSWRARYDAAGHPVEVVRDGVAVFYEWNGLGRLVARRGDHGERFFHHDPLGRVLFETDASGRIVAHYVHRGGVVVAAVFADGPRFLHTEVAGNVVALTGAEGTVCAAYAYAPFGDVVASTGPDAERNPLTFGGALGVRDEGRGLYLTANRLYDARLGRFVQRDPIGLAGGTNPYAYAGANPVTNVDPAGTDWLGNALDTARSGFSRIQAAVDEIRENPVGWWDENVGQPIADRLRDWETNVNRPRRDRLVGTSENVDVGRSPGGFDTWNRVAPRIRPGVSADELPSAEQIRDATLRDTQEFLEAVEDVPGSPQGTVSNIIDATKKVAEGDPGAIVDLGNLARGPLAAPHGDRLLDALNTGTDMIQQGGDWIRRGANVRDAARRSATRGGRGGCGTP